MHNLLYKTPRLIGQVLLVVLLLVMLGAQVVSAQDLPPCTEALALELTDNDGVDQAMDIDKDGDGLIEVCDLEGLYEMRYVPDGSGYSTSPTTTPIRTGCPSGGNCSGFELTRNLSFTDNASYRTVANRVRYTIRNYDDDDDTGWEPIGTSFSNRFNTRFEGNGHTVFNLMINRRSADEIGLFGVVGTMANIANIGLINVNIIGSFNVGGLVGRNIEAIITNSYATGSVSGDSLVGGLAGQNSGGTITNSYAKGSVSGNNILGGLVGDNSIGSITNSYATSSVSGDDRVGGLVGSTSGPITNSYATGFDDALFGASVGSLPITNSSTKTEMELRTPTAARGIYSDWSTDVWDFGTPNDLPTLKDVPEIELIRIRTKVFLEGPLQ